MRVLKFVFDGGNGCKLLALLLLTTWHVPRDHNVMTSYGE